MALPPSWSQATATTPAHNTFLQPLTSPPSNQERGEERRDGGLVVVCFILSAELLHGHNTGKSINEIPCRKQLLLINMFLTARVLITFVNSSQIILSDQFLCVFSTKVQFNEKPTQWFTDAQQGTNGNLMFSQHVNTPLLHISVLHRDVMGCISQSVSPKLLLDSSSSSRTGAGPSPPLLPSYLSPKPSQALCLLS